MGTILKSCLLTLLVVMMQGQAANADSSQHQDKLFFSPAEIALSEELDNARGREGLEFTFNNQDVQAMLSDNQASNNASGFNTINNGSFTEANGITYVVQNTGNNVLIQNALIVQVQITP